MSMRDTVAAAIAVLLLLVALGMFATLQYYRRRRQENRLQHATLGRTIIAEVPSGNDLVLFSEDATRFFHGTLPIEKSEIHAVRLLINGAPLAAYRSASEAAPAAEAHHRSLPDLAGEETFRDRWDVDIETARRSVVVACGAIRDRVSQELARTIYEAVVRSMEVEDRASRGPTG
jgi:hypothetical protein